MTEATEPTARERLPQLLTPEQVAATMPKRDGKCVSVRTVQRLAKAGIIPGAKRIGRHLFFQRGAVLAWIDGGALGTVHALPRRAG